MLDGLGVRTGVDMAALLDTGRFISGHLGRKPVSKAHMALAKTTAPSA
jgi:hydroxymethylglutaryl-CoA lyase